MPLAREINQGIQAVQVQSEQAAEHSSEWGRAGVARRLGAAAAPMRGLLLRKAHNWWVRTVCITNLLISLLHCILTCPAAPAAPLPLPPPPPCCAADELQAARAELSRLSNLVFSFQQAVCQLLPTGMPGPHP